MADESYLEAVATRLMPDGDSPFAGDNAEAGMALVVAQAVRDLCWSTMTYACKKCGYEWKVYLALGVEGPKTLKEQKLYVPCPFIIRCYAWPNMETCDGEMSHVRWHEDLEFLNPVVPADDKPRFVLPDSTGTCARLHVPERALVEARRALNEDDQ